MIKVCVGASTVYDLYSWQKERQFSKRKYGIPTTRHVTRMFPKKKNEILNEGSLYWVFKGYILARQQILDLEGLVGLDGIMRCAIILDTKIINTQPTSRKPFQGWRYLKTEDAPNDTKLFSAEEPEIPANLEKNLLDIGVL